MVKTKAVVAKVKSKRSSVEKLKAPQLKSLQYLLAATSYVSLIEGSACRSKTQKLNLQA